MPLTRIDVLEQHIQSSEVVWNDTLVAVPSGAMIIDTDNNVIKIGNGTTLFSNLPTTLNFNFGSDKESGVCSLTQSQVGNLVVAKNGLFTPSTTSLSNIINQLSIFSTPNVSLSSTLQNYNTQLNIIFNIQSNVLDNTLVIFDNNQFKPWNKTLTQYISDISRYNNTGNQGMHLDGIAFYSDEELTIPVNNLSPNNTYYASITGFHDTCELTDVNFNISSSDSKITIKRDDIIESTDSIVYLLTSSLNTTKEMFLNINGSIIDEFNNIYLVGNISNGNTSSKSVFIKINDSGSITAFKVLDSIGYFNSIAYNQVTSSIVLVGQSLVNNTVDDFEIDVNNQYGVVLLLDIDLNIKKCIKIGLSSNQIYTYFNNCCFDLNNNIIVTGKTNSELSYQNNIIIYLSNPNLTIMFNKIFNLGITKNPYLHFNKIKCNSSNIFLIGYDYNTGRSYLIKFDFQLNIVATKYFNYAIPNANVVDRIRDITFDSQGNIIIISQIILKKNNETKYHYGFIINKLNYNLSLLKQNLILAESESKVSLIHYNNSTSFNSDKFLHYINNSILLNNSGNSFTSLINGFNDENGIIPDVIIKFDNNLNISLYKNFSQINISDLTSDKLFGFTSSILFDNKQKVTFIPSSVLLNNINIPLFSKIDNFQIDYEQVVHNENQTVKTINTNYTSLDPISFLYSSLTDFSNSNFNNSNQIKTDLDVTLEDISDWSSSIKIIPFIKNNINNPTEYLKVVVYSTSYNDQFIANDTDSNGNIFAVGFTSFSDNINHGLIVKTDPSGNVLSRLAINNIYSCQLNSVMLDKDNNVIIVGQSKASNSALYDAFIIKVNNTLTTIIYQQMFSTTSNDIFSDLTVTNDAYYVVGYSSLGTSNQDSILLKFDFYLNCTKRVKLSGSNSELFSAICTTNKNTICCVGSTNSEVSNTTNALLVELDINFNIINKFYISSSDISNSNFNMICSLSDNTLIAVGYATLNSLKHGLICKFDTNRGLLSSNYYGSNYGLVQFTGITCNEDNECYITGKCEFYGPGALDSLIINTDENTNVKYSKIIGTTGEDANIDIVYKNPYVYTVGYLNDNTTNGLIIKFDKLVKGTFTSKIFTDFIVDDILLEQQVLSTSVNQSTLSLSTISTALIIPSLSLSNATGAVLTDDIILNPKDNKFQVIIDDIVLIDNRYDTNLVISSDDGTFIKTKTIPITLTQG